ncbi:MAG: YdcF family protein [Anaerolineae bacterium]|nr:YdcF family protein [Anaerolineae bacterium]MBT3712392.1 YdcF family protein [Anaerolineae bacterium]MBT4311985.1 YdcF family protein [Anaerolineae bacterium]MBT4458133.1 YdcF family protein [Anaerolineae bacterium]MBT6059572.1 YdcF family protein [Anaerolineae bacterium]
MIPDKLSQTPDCFVIPSYALKDHTRPTRPTINQIKLAISWWKRYPKATLLMCTGDNQGLGVSNASVMAAYAIQLGVPIECIIEEDQSKNTYENLYNAQKIIKGQGYSQPTLVTLDLYTRRAVATAHKIGWKNIVLGISVFTWRASLWVQVVSNSFSANIVSLRSNRNDIQ